MRARSKSYTAWHNIKQRCFNVGSKSFKNYGGRGITLQSSWIDDPAAFSAYVEGLPGFAEDMTLERLDNDADYQEGNLAWVPRSVQAKNRRRMENNTSGVTGVYFMQNASKLTYAMATWREGSVSRYKSFSVKKLGLLPAFTAAFEHRKMQMAALNSQGAGYSAKHGL